MPWQFLISLAIFRAHRDCFSIISTPPGHQFWNTGNTRWSAYEVRFSSFHENIVQDWKFYHHRHLFFSYFCCYFSLLSNRCLQRILCGELALPFNILFVYHIVFFYLLHQTSMKWYPENYLPRALFELILMFWLVDIFWCPSRFQVI